MYWDAPARPYIGLIGWCDIGPRQHGPSSPVHLTHPHPFHAYPLPPHTPRTRVSQVALSTFTDLITVNRLDKGQVKLDKQDTHPWR